VETDLSYVKGKLINEASKTRISITVRPNSIFVIVFYFAALISILEPIGAKEG
jgi:hypothetical protein